jgi:hypothetical protein
MSDKTAYSTANEFRALRAMVIAFQRLSPASRRWLLERLSADNSRTGGAS